MVDRGRSPRLYLPNGLGSSETGVGHPQLHLTLETVYSQIQALTSNEA